MPEWQALEAGVVPRAIEALFQHIRQVRIEVFDLPYYTLPKTNKLGQPLCDLNQVLCEGGMPSLSYAVFTYCLGRRRLLDHRARTISSTI